MAMLCTLSGEVPQVPVVSRKSGNVYEKRLIEAYISENGTEPSTGGALAVEDLLELKTSHTVRPRPPTLTSIPSLLSVFQEEWDALALETYTLQQNLAQTRQELSTALYQQDAAVRVIARLTRERDEARDALSKINFRARSRSADGANGDSMQLDSAPLPEVIIAKIENTQEALTKTRRKRPVPEDWATSESISNYKPTTTSEPLSPDAKFLAVNNSGDSVLFGGADSVAEVYSIAEARVTQTLKAGGGALTDGLWAGSKAIVATSTGKVKIFEGQQEVASFQSHAGSATGLTLHPSGDILASVGEDKSYVLYDMSELKLLAQIFTDSELSCTQFHPDGHLLAVGGSDGQIKIFDVKSGTLGAAFEVGEPLKAIFFSENGTWLAAATVGSSLVSIWDLRKASTATGPIKTLETGSEVESIDWDYSAQFLLLGGPGGVTVWQYSKAAKEWSELFKAAVPANGVAWGKASQSIMTVDTSGVLTVLSQVS